MKEITVTEAIEVISKFGRNKYDNIALAALRTMEWIESNRKSFTHTEIMDKFHSFQKEGAE